MLHASDGFIEAHVSQIGEQSFARRGGTDLSRQLSVLRLEMLAHFLNELGFVLRMKTRRAESCSNVRTPIIHIAPPQPG